MHNLVESAARWRRSSSRGRPCVASCARLCLWLFVTKRVGPPAGTEQRCASPTSSMTSSKIAPYPSAASTGGEPLEVLNMSQRTNDSAASQQTPPPPVVNASTKEESVRSDHSGSKSMSKVKASAAAAGVASRKISARAEAADAVFKSSMRAADYRSGRGHDLDGGGLHVGHGQLEQAKDRNFVAVLDRCRVATKSLAALRPVVCVASCRELQGLGALRPCMQEGSATKPGHVHSHTDRRDLVCSCHAACAVSQVAGMLAYLEHLFHENTKKTIVSLKQLCNQLEAADHAAAPFGVAPSFCSRLCGGAGAAEKAGNVRTRPGPTPRPRTHSPSISGPPPQPAAPRPLPSSTPPPPMFSPPRLAGGAAGEDQGGAHVRRLAPARARLQGVRPRRVCGALAAQEEHVRQRPRLVRVAGAALVGRGGRRARLATVEKGDATETIIGLGRSGLRCLDVTQEPRPIFR